MQKEKRFTKMDSETGATVRVSVVGIMKHVSRYQIWFIQDSADDFRRARVDLSMCDLFPEQVKIESLGPAETPSCRRRKYVHNRLWVVDLLRSHWSVVDSTGRS
jgi:hypothetical protein